MPKERVDTSSVSAVTAGPEGYFVSYRNRLRNIIIKHTLRPKPLHHMLRIGKCKFQNNFLVHVQVATTAKLISALESVMFFITSCVVRIINLINIAV
jgi:hypothetical protein